MVKRAANTEGSGPTRKPPGGESRAILARVNADGLRALKILAIERDTTLQALAVEAFNDLLAKYGKRSVVKKPLSAAE
jgi:hypothetical protein